MEHTGTPDGVDEVAGFRLVRRIGTGSRSEVYLGKAAAGRNATAALKLFRADAEPGAVDRQVRALLAVPPLTLTRLTDVASTSDGRACLVLERLAGMSLAGLLAERGRIGSGEVVTILATITAALNALHEAGFSHPAVTPAGVRFDASGRPVLLGLGALDDLPAGAGGAARRRDDLMRLAGVTRAVFDHLDQRAPEYRDTDTVLAVFEAAATRRPAPANLSELEATLFAWAPAAAVSGAVPGGANEAAVQGEPAGPALSTRAAGRTGSVSAGARPDPVSAPFPGLAPLPVNSPRTGATRLRWPVPAGWAGRLDRARSAGERFGASAAAAGRRARAARPVRLPRRLPGTPVAVAVGLAVLLVGGALMLSSGTPRSVPGGRAAAEPSSPAPMSGAAATGAPESGAPASTVPTAASLQADDPAAAVLDLLRLRHGCLAAASVLCLDGVDQAGSVAMAADSYLVRAAQASQGASNPEPAAEHLVAEVRERTGNSALVVLGSTDTGSTDAGSTDAGSTDAGSAQVSAPARTQPASALVIKGEAGWRLRELFDY